MCPKPEQDDQLPAQSEMPFAVVDGEPVTELPQDLYIPPYALQVFLEAFEGPLDLLALPDSAPEHRRVGHPNRRNFASNTSSTSK